METKEITLCCNCGWDRETVDKQMELLKPLDEVLDIHWNNRIDRHPDTYPSFSEMINDSITSSPTEIVIWLNDRVTPKPEDVIHIVELLESGFAAASKYSAAFFGATKELYRTIGWWDQRFYGGGWEDDDFVIRLRLANLAYYESQESEYLEARILNQPEKITPLSPKDGANGAKSFPHFNKKWRQLESGITKVLPEESYPEYDKLAGPKREDISSKWLGWHDSILGVDYKYPIAGESRTKWFCYLTRDKGVPIKENGEWLQYRPVLSDCDG
tara:strand:+ start:197 stop:1012 length:816 start_codon:yes stop_codon:yes gene_type:complete